MATNVYNLLWDFLNIFLAIEDDQTTLFKMTDEVLLDIMEVSH